MYSAFEKLPAEKKEHILSICIEEFAKNGYDHTTTDQITSKAGISKGILFHYFKSKKNLFLYLVDHVRELLTTETMKEVQLIESNDFFERIKAIILIKHRLAFKYQHESEFLMKAMLQAPASLREEMEDRYQQQWEQYESDDIFHSVYMKELLDQQELKVDADHIIELTRLILEQLTVKYVNNYRQEVFDPLKNLQQFEEEIDVYFKIIKHGIYK